MADIFISYKSNNPELGNNDETVANELCTALERAGITCWIAPRNIPFGSRYDDEIVDAIEGCHAILVVFSKHTYNSKWMPDEARIAYENGKTMFSFIIDDSQFQKKWKLYLGGSQKIDAQGDYRLKFPELITALKHKLGNASTTSVDVTLESKRKSSSNRQKPKQQWPSPESIVIEDVAEENEDDKKPTARDRFIGAAKGVAAGVIGGPTGMAVGMIAGATKPEWFDFSKGNSEENSQATQEMSPCETFTINGVSFTMIRVEGGTFRMGDPKQLEQEDAFSDTDPKSPVSLTTFYLGETPVTQMLWRTVMASNPSYNKGDLQLPVEKVSWNDCQMFIQRLKKLTGRNFYLPTEAEWEFAARGGIKSKGYKFAGSDNLDEVGWYFENSDETTHPVGMKRPNELGLYDMSGNVWEWCKTKDESHRIYRGGCYLYRREDCTVYCINSLTPSSRFDTGGFRLALRDDR